jgi:hypothetical protein
MPRIPALLAAASAALSLPATAQFPAPTVPRGQFAVEIRTWSEGWDQRFLAGGRQPAGTDFTRQGIGANWFPALRDADALLAELAGTTGPVLNLGSFSAIQMTTERELGLGAAVGLTSRLTVSALVPLRRVRVRTATTYNPDGANAGFNPVDPGLGTPGGAGQTITFFAAFDAALGTLSDRLASGYWDADPATRAVAQHALSEGRALREGLYTVMVEPATRAAVLPTAGSLAGTAILNRIAALQSQFANLLQIGGFTGQPAFPAAAFTPDAWDTFLTDPAGPIAGSLLAPPYTALGDIELGAAYLLIDRRPAHPWGAALRLAGHATVRLRTSQLPNPARFFEIGTGDRQPDLEAMISADFAHGRAAVRLAGWYNHQYPGNQLRRIGPPGEPLRYANTAAAVRKDPGDILGVSILPAYRFTPRFAFLGGVEWWQRGDDVFDYVEGQPPLDGVNPADLGRDSGASALSVRAGLTWSHPGDGRAPLDAGITWERVVSASGGRVPQREVVRGMLRLYGRLW